MYKEMIPAEVIARQAKGRSSSDGSTERPIIQTAARTGNEDGALQNELAEWKERCLRLAAEFDNFRKRTARESDRRAAEQKTAFIRDLLPVVDNLERALANGPAYTAKQLREGVDLTLRQLTRLLNQHGFTSRDDLGQPFDPQFHEAVCVRSELTDADHAVLEVWQRGWVHGKELFRPAKVVVNDLKHRHPAGNPENNHHEKAEYHG